MKGGDNLDISLLTRESVVEYVNALQKDFYH